MVSIILTKIVLLAYLQLLKLLVRIQHKDYHITVCFLD